MPFNSEGRYFDEETMTVYKESSVLVYGLITMCVFILTAIVGLITRQVSKRK
jgi:hypothetical protein